MPRNSEHFHRQLGILPYKRISGTQVTIFGAGGIGSWVALMAIKMGVEYLTVIDGDIVEGHNQPSQLYGKRHIGQKKVLALQEIIEDFEGVQIHIVPEMWTPAMRLRGGQVYVLAIDNLKVREEMWQAIKALPFPAALVIDPRMGAEFFEQWIIDPTKASSELIASYEEDFKGEAFVAPCTEKATGYCTFTAAGKVLSQYTNWLIGRDVKTHIREDIPSAVIYGGLMDTLLGKT